MGLCAQTPGHIVVQEKGFSCTHIVYHNGHYLFSHLGYQYLYNQLKSLQLSVLIIFLTFSIYFSKKIGFMEKIVQKKEKNLGLQF